MSVGETPPDPTIPYGPEGHPWRDTVSDIAKLPDNKFLIAPPSRDPCKEYAGVTAHVTGRYYQVPSTKLTEQQQAQAQQETLKLLTTQKAKFVGYQANQEMSQYPDLLKPYLGFHSNNIGDPFTAGNFTLNTKWMECSVLDYYASLWNGKWPYNSKDDETYWGYVLTMGSTEGNLYAAWNARDYLSGKCLYYDPSALQEAFEEIKSGAKRVISIPYGFTYGQAQFATTLDGRRQNENAFSPVVFYSEDTHYSNIKATQTIDIPTFYSVGMEKYRGQCPLPGYGDKWPTEVPSKDGALGPGTIDIEDLKTLVNFFTEKGHPVYIVLNYGATFKGTYDDVKMIGDKLRPILEKNGMYEREIVLPNTHPEKREIRKGFWIHVDGALGASYMPFIKMAAMKGPKDGLKPGPEFDFSLDFVSSIVTSGHKWIGAPIPCGVYLTRNKYRIKPPDDTPIYVGSPDTTFAGSRNSLSCAVLWTYISTHSYDDQVKKVLHCLEMAKYTFTSLEQLQTDLNMDLWVTNFENSLSVYFRKPNEKIVCKYTLSSEMLSMNNDKGNLETRHYSHIYMMEHVTKEKINELISDLRAPDAFPKQQPHEAAKKIENWLASQLSAVQIPHAQEHKPRPLMFMPVHGRGYK